MARLPELVDQFQNAGTTVHVVTLGEPLPITPATNLAAYRIIQEALTNVIRHAPGASADVSLRYTVNGLELEVCDDGTTWSGGRATAASGTRYGLSGLRERTVALGGTFEAGAIEPAGFRVRAHLPTTTSS